MKDFARRAGELGAQRRLPLSCSITTLALMLTTMVLVAPAARAALGYEPDTPIPSIALAGEFPHGVAIDQANQRIYVAMLSTDLSTGASGQIDQLESAGAPTAASPFALGSEAFPGGVAVNPLTQGIYVAQFIAQSPVGPKGSSKILQFSAAGTPGAEFATSNIAGKAPQIATDSSGNVYFPSNATNTVQVFNSAGVPQGTVSCAACPGGAFAGPASVAVDSAGNVYVVDVQTDRVIKFTHSGGTYSFASELQSGRGAAAVAVDPSDNSVYVGDLFAGEYHVVAYNSTGAQFDDFGSDLFATPTQGAVGAGQIAVNATTHKLYVSEPNTNRLLVFARVTIHPPSASTDPASSVGQVSTKLNATVNANFHALTACRFEYTDAADFAANGYTNATDLSCPSLPGGSTSTPISSTLTGLSPGATYHYRIVATNNAGTTEGSDASFTTLPTTPSTVTAEAASGVTQSAATLIGKVNPHGGTVSNCHFEYGVGLSYSVSVPCPTTVGVVTTDVAQKKAVSGLSANTTYHYRLKVTSNAGPVTSNDIEFTTLAPPPVVPPVTPATTPSPPAVLPPPVLSPPPTAPKPLKCKKGFRKKKVHGKFKCVKVKRHKGR
jgi:DNA-binding beta-propeller fold protein YncE